MFSNYSMHFSPPFFTSLFGWVLLIQQFICASTTCPPPDFPLKGGYGPQKAEYQLGETVSYHCNASLLFYVRDKDLKVSKKEVTCQSSGKWSEGTPFCDHFTPLKKPFDPNSIEQILDDGNWDTCFEIRSNAQEIVEYSLERAAASYSILLCFGKGKGTFDLSFLPTDWFHSYKAEDVAGNCKLMDIRDAYSLKTEFIKMKFSTGSNSSISLCEIAVYMKDDAWCEHPPEYSVPNGQLKVSRNEAVLICNEGFKEKYGKYVHATCKNDKWSFLGLQCVSENEILCAPSVGYVSPSEGEWASDDKTSDHSFGTKKTLNCKHGYQREGEPSTVTCLQNGTWTRTTASCKKILCESFFGSVRPSEGKWESDGNTSEHSVRTNLTLNCKPGYQSDGEPLTVTCHENGAWTSTTATCKKILCEPFVGNNSPLEGEWGSDDKTSEHYFGTKKTLNCKPGYQREGEPSTVTCLQNGTWTRTTASCKKILCQPYVANVSPLEGQWESDEKNIEHFVGTKMTLNCKPEYQREGEPSTVTCLENGTWTRTTASCEKYKLEMDYKISVIIIGSVSVIIILILIGVIIFLVSKKPGSGSFTDKSGKNDYSMPSSVGFHSTTGLSENELSTVHIYERFNTRE